MKTVVFVRCYAKAVKEQKMSSSMSGYGKYATCIAGVDSMDFMSGVFPSKSLGSTYMSGFMKTVLKDRAFSFFIFIIFIIILFAIPMAAACKYYLA